MAQRPEQLLARIWMDWEYLDRMNIENWNPTISLFEDVKEWALHSSAVDQVPTDKPAVAPEREETGAFIPREPVVIHGPLPTPLPEFEGIDYPIGGKPEEKAEKEP